MNGNIILGVNNVPTTANGKFLIKSLLIDNFKSFGKGNEIDHLGSLTKESITLLTTEFAFSPSSVISLIESKTYPVSVIGNFTLSQSTNSTIPNLIFEIFWSI